MPVLQSWNPRIKAWVKFKFKTVKGKTDIDILDVKQKNPSVKFKGVKVSSTSKRK